MYIPFLYKVRVHAEEQACNLHIAIQDTHDLSQSVLTEVGIVEMTAI